MPEDTGAVGMFQQNPAPAAAPDPPLLSWEEILGMITRWGTFYETCEPSDSPFPGDPDGGELRLVMALRGVADEAAAAERVGGLMQPARLRRVLTDRLIEP